MGKNLESRLMKIAQIEGLGEIYKYNPWVTGENPDMNALGEVGADIVTCRDLAYARPLLIPTHPLNRMVITTGLVAYTGHGNQALLIPDFEGSKELVQKLINRSLKMERLAYCVDQFKEIANADRKKEPEKQRAIMLPWRDFSNWNGISGRFYISPSKNWNIARSVFKDRADPLFKWLYSLGEEEMRFYVDLASANSDHEPYVAPLTFETERKMTPTLDGRSFDADQGAYCAYASAGFVGIKRTVQKIS